MANGQIIQIPTEKLPDLFALSGQGFEFTWDLQSASHSIVIAYVYEGEILSLIEFTRNPSDLSNFVYKLETHEGYRNMGLAGTMLATVAQDAKGQGFDGFVFAISKTTLLRFYVDKLGAKQIGNTNRIYFDTQASDSLIEKYLKGRDLL
jgi:hypothetical protein